MSTVLLTTAEYPQTSLISCSRETAALIARKSARSKANSFGAIRRFAMRGVRCAKRWSTFEAEHWLPCRNWSGLWGKVQSAF
jgi:hypothetical protein